MVDYENIIWADFTFTRNSLRYKVYHSYPGFPFDFSRMNHFWLPCSQSYLIFGIESIFSNCNRRVHFFAFIILHNPNASYFSAIIENEYAKLCVHKIDGIIWTTQVWGLKQGNYLLIWNEFQLYSKSGSCLVFDTKFSMFYSFQNSFYANWVHMKRCSLFIFTVAVIIRWLAISERFHNFPVSWLIFPNAAAP